jgi:glycosyltransferase involved in cell wall biosynthesis
MRIAVVENLANSAYVQAKMLNRLGQVADLILDPHEHYVMSDPRWEELDLELPTDQLFGPELPDCQLPVWVRKEQGDTADDPARSGRLRSGAALLGGGPQLWRAAARALRWAGRIGVIKASERPWLIRTLAEYDCVIAYGSGPIWAALADVPCVAETWGGDITMLPFYDTGDWEGHDAIDLPGPREELFALAKLQRMGYDHASRILLTDPRFLPYSERLGHAHKSVHLGFLIDTDKYAPQPEPELRERLLKGRDGLIVFVPSRQDWYWKGSDRLLRGFAQIADYHQDAILVCAGWGDDLVRSRQLIADLGIGTRVHLLPCAMSKERLRRYYCAADVVADQFTVGSYGGSALEAMACSRPLLISLDRNRFTRELRPLPPVMNVCEPAQIAAALSELLGSGELRASLGARSREWVIAHHGPSLAERVLDLCREVASGTE